MLSMSTPMTSFLKRGDKSRLILPDLMKRDIKPLAEEREKKRPRRQSRMPSGGQHGMGWNTKWSRDERTKDKRESNIPGILRRLAYQNSAELSRQSQVAVHYAEEEIPFKTAHRQIAQPVDACSVRQLLPGGVVCCVGLAVRGM